MREEIFY